MASRMMRTCEFCNQFIPHYHPEVLAKVRQWKKPRKIFWQSMGDLFHPHTPNWLIQEVLYTVKNDLRHTHIFLTKNPKRYREFNPWPPNCHVGTTITNQADAIERLEWLLQVVAPVRFISHEPILGPIDMNKAWWIQIATSESNQCNTSPNWAIIGAQTGPGAVPPDPAWIQGLIDQYRAAGVPIFLKDNLTWREKIQVWP